MGRFWQTDRPLVCRGILAVIGGILVQLTLGTMYSYGNMAPYIISYCRFKGHDAILTYTTSSIVLAAMKLGHGISMWGGGYLERRLGVRWATFIGIVILSSSMFLSAWSITVSFYFLLFTYGLMFGVGIGIAYVPPIVCVMKWMPEAKGLATGCLLAGFGGGPFIFNFIQTLFINPHNLAPDVKNDDGGVIELFYSQDVILERVPYSFLVQGIIFVILQLIGIALLKDPPSLLKRTRRYAIRRKDEATEKSAILMAPQSPRHPPKGATSFTDDHDHESSIDVNSKDQPSTSSATPAGIGSYDDDGSYDDGDGKSARDMSVSMGDKDWRWSGRSLSPLELFKEVFFWQLLVVIFLDNTSLVFVSSQYKAFGQTFTGDDHFLALVGSFASLFHAAGKVFWGYMADRFSFKVSFMTLSCVMSALMFTLPLSTNKPMLFIWVCGVFCTLGGVFSTAPTATSRAFGSEFVGVNYGFVYLFSVSVSALVSSGIQVVLLRVLSWEVLFLVAGALPAISMIVSMFMKVKTPKGLDI